MWVRIELPNLNGRFCGVLSVCSGMDYQCPPPILHNGTMPTGIGGEAIGKTLETESSCSPSALTLSPATVALSS